MLIPTPQELGLPAKFDSWRPQQEDALQRLLYSTKRFKALCVPTGGGKTVIYVAYALITKLPTCFVTDNRGLQDQILFDFAPVGMVDIRGRQNYDCHMQPEMTCQEGFTVSCPMKGTVQCPASQAEMRAAISSLVVTNYDKWTASRKFGLGMNHFKQVVFDEGHKSHAALARSLTVTLSHQELDEIRLEPPPVEEQEEMVNWKPWAQRARLIVDGAYQRAKRQVESAHPPKPHWIRQLNHYRYLLKRLGMLSSAQPENWVADTTDKGFQFDPVRLHRYAEGLLFLRIPSVLVVSGTLRPKSLYMLGVGKEHFDFLEYDSDFDPKRCPIYYVPTMPVDSKHPDLSLLWIKFDQIAGRRRDVKGICHTISFARRTELLDASRFSGSMLLNEKGEAPTWIVDEFKGAAAGTILASPSIGEGYDFPDDECRWQFVCKIPFPDSRSKIVRARQNDDAEYGPFQAATKLEQIFGRPMRSQGDWAEGFICDMHLEWFMKRYGYLFTRSFHRRYQQVQFAPAPLSL